MTDRLSIYNGALLVLKQRRLESLTERLPYRYDLDAVWDDKGREDCLEAGLWNFAMRTSELNYEPSITPDFGFQYAFEKPSDWVRLNAISADGYFVAPYQRFRDEAGYLFSDLTKLYVSYVSKDASYGLDMAKWPESFKNFVHAHFAWKIAGRVSGVDPTDIETIRKRMLAVARSNDASGEPAVPLPRGSWAQARTRGIVTRSERGR